MCWKNMAYLAYQTILQGTGTERFKTHTTWAMPRNPGQTGSLFLVQSRGSAHVNTSRVYVRVVW